MPRVSDAHLAARRQQIIDAATRCFLRNGFHQTSMQDVIKEADLSVGAFYRYFTSKSELIKAIAGEKISAVVERVDGLLRQEPAPPLVAVIGEILAQVDASLGEEGPARIAVQVWGEAVHDPEIGAIVDGVYAQVRSSATALAARAVRAGQLPDGADPASVGAVMFGLIQGYILQRVLIGEIDRLGYLAGIEAMLTGPTTA